MDKKQPKSAAHTAAHKAKPVDGGSIIVVRIRGMRTTPGRIEHTMLLMNLSRKYHVAILPNDAISRGMIEHAKDFITYGPANAKAVEELFSKRGRTADGKGLTDDYLKTSKSGFNSIKELSAAVLAGTTRLSRVKQVKAIFRLNPPRIDSGSIKGVFPNGALGVRNDKEMEALIASMI
ncbi:MAG: uL30 family ribosomal protein [Candidatus Micrarchaeia archaeon]